MGAEERDEKLYNEKKKRLFRKPDNKSYPLLCCVILFVFLLDRASKELALSLLEVGQTFPLIKGVFHFTLVKNPGAAFGLLPYRTSFFVAVTALAVLLILLAAIFLTFKYKAIRISLALLAGGALGNVYDRISTGYVIDFLDFRIWPVFNLADVAIVAGVLLFLLNIKHVSDD